MGISILFAGRPEVLEEVRAIISRTWIKPGNFEHFGSWMPIAARLDEETAAKQFVLLDYFALWGSGPDLSDYKAFLQRYAQSRAKQEQRTRLLIVRCTSDPTPEVMVGWGTLVDAYCSLPLEEEACRSLFSRIEAEFMTATRG